MSFTPKELGGEEVVQTHTTVDGDATDDLPVLPTATGVVGKPAVAVLHDAVFLFRPRHHQIAGVPSGENAFVVFVLLDGPEVGTEIAAEQSRVTLFAKSIGVDCVHFAPLVRNLVCFSTLILAGFRLSSTTVASFSFLAPVLFETCRVCGILTRLVRVVPSQRGWLASLGRLTYGDFSFAKWGVLESNQPNWHLYLSSQSSVRWESGLHLGVYSSMHQLH